MANQYLALVEETTRGTDPGAGYVFYPVTGSIQPQFNATDEPRKEFRGVDTALGDATVRRLSSAWEQSLAGYLYSGAELDLLLKHLLGHAGTRAEVDTTAYAGLFYPLAQPYGSGRPLGDSAIGVIPNTDEGGTTLSQYYGGGRIRSIAITGEPGSEVTMEATIGGAGPWVGDADQTAIAAPSFPAAAPFHFAEARFYIGSGITRTGVAPDFTDIAPGTMQTFMPDNFTLTLTNGLEDSEVANGVRGPSKTSRSGQFSGELTFTLDYEDPSTGFSSADEFKKTFAGPNTNSILIVLDNGQLAGAASENYQMIIDLPLLHLAPDTPERNSEGQQAKVSYTCTSLLNSTVGYPVGILTVNQNDGL